MKILKNIFSWLLDRWQLLLAALVTFVAYSKIKENERMQADRAASEAAEKTRQAKILAEEEEKERVRQAEIKAEEEKKNRDEKIKKERTAADEKIDQEVKDQINEDLKDPEKLAQDFANTFGGSYVKKND
jgi:hypothetical protein